jgi:hypothetical protein
MNPVPLNATIQASACCRAAELGQGISTPIRQKRQENLSFHMPHLRIA